MTGYINFINLEALLYILILSILFLFPLFKRLWVVGRVSIPDVQKQIPLYIAKMKAFTLTVNTFLTKPLFLTLYLICILFLVYFSIFIEWIYPLEKIIFALATVSHLVFLISKSECLKKTPSILLSGILILQFVPWLYFLSLSIDWFGGVMVLEREVINFKLYYVIEENGFKNSAYFLKRLTLGGSEEIYSIDKSDIDNPECFFNEKFIANLKAEFEHEQLGDKNY